MNTIKPKHPYSLVIEQANQGSKRKASEGGDDDRGPEPGQGICAKCANAAHDGDCKKIEEAAGNDEAIKRIRKPLSSDHVSSDEEMGDAEEPSSSTPKGHKTGEQMGKETIEMYSYTINLVEMADTAEGGELQCGGVDLTVNPCGDHRTFKTTMERGCDTIPCYIPRFGDVSSVDLPWAYASMTDPKFFPKGASLEQIDVQQPGKSINFCLQPFNDAPFGKIGDEHSVFGTRDQANQLSHDLCRILRHKIGNCRGSAFKCDEGGWVDIDAIINAYGVNIFPPKTARERRYMGIVEVMKWQESGYKKSRFQILAVRYPSTMNLNDMRAARQELSYMGHDQGEINVIFNRCDGWYRPWCIRATTGHSDFGFMSSSALANRYSARTGDSLGHVTYVENLPGIVRCGLVPGGIGGGNRLALHFGAFAPWGKMNLATKTSLRNLRVGDPIAIIYIPSATLARYGAGVAFNGTFMVFDVIPFYEVKSIWIGKCNEGKRLDIERAYSTCVENEICPAFVGSSQESALMFLQNVAKVIEGSPKTKAGADNLHYVKDMVDRACELFRGGQHQELEALTNEIRDEISKTIMLNDETWEGLRCRICPSCAAAIPTCFCICLECEAQLISTGRFRINVSSGDDDDDHEPNVSGDARRAQEEANDNAAAQGKDGGMEDDPEDDDMGTQGYTSGNVSEEEDSEWDYRDNDTRHHQLPKDGNLHG